MPKFSDASPPTAQVENFKCHCVLLQFFSEKFGSDWASGKIEAILKEISFRAVCLLHSLMPLQMPLPYNCAGLPLYSPAILLQGLL